MFSDAIRERFSRLTRRNLFAVTGMAAMAQGLRAQSASPASTGGLQIGPDLFKSIGVRPLINCKGTFTIVSGSQSLPEVKQAMVQRFAQRWLGALQAGSIRPVIDSKFPLAQAAQAHRRMESGESVGKILLLPGEC